jgi:ankyrin repeat protein
MTPLMAAAAMGNELLVRALLAAGADASLTCSSGAHSLIVVTMDDGPREETLVRVGPRFKTR